MRLIIAAIADVLATFASASELPVCKPSEVLSAAKALEPLAQPPELLTRIKEQAVRAVSIFEPELGNDAYKYIALVDGEAKKVWLYRYGGFDGQVAWFGPLAVSPSRVATCAVARGPVWLGGNTLFMSEQLSSVPQQ